VVMSDSLGICAELDAAMAAHVASYRDEWAEALADPGALSQFVSFLNRPEVADPELAYVEERGQRRPATAAEREADQGPRGPVLVAGPELEVR
jgi:nitrite reductase (NADH) large subunit